MRARYYGRLIAAFILLLHSVAAIAQSPANRKPASANPQQQRLQDRVFHSASLDRQVHYRILLPAGYEGSLRRYPVLYLLHGWHGDYRNWSTLTNLAQYAESLPILIVMPDAGDSWYTNSVAAPRDKFETYIVQDLIEEVDQNWRTLPSAYGRAIAGLSMGGYGAVKFALKHPDKFKFAGSLSGAFNATQAELRQSRSDLAPSLDAAFGDQLPEAEDVFRLAERADSTADQYYYIDCGNRDVDFVQANRAFVALLARYKASYEYHEVPGGHNWEYWDKRLPDLLNAATYAIAGSTYPFLNSKGKLR